MGCCKITGRSSVLTGFIKCVRGPVGLDSRYRCDESRIQARACNLHYRVAALILLAASLATAASGQLTVSPSTATVVQGGSLQLSYSSTISIGQAKVAWDLWPQVGSVSSTGLYTAPASVSASTSVRVVVYVIPVTKTTAPLIVAANLTVVPVSVSVTPSTSSLGPNQTQAFTATVTNTTNTAVTWSTSPAVGTVSASGLYTAPASIASAQSVTVTAKSVADGTKTAVATVSLVPPVIVKLNQTSVALTQGKTTQFTASVANATNTSVTWSLSPAVGTISSSGLYTAPSVISVQQTVTVTATSVASPAVLASATITLSPPVQPAIVLPLEVMASSGTATNSVQVNVPANSALSGPISLWLQIHGLEYQTQASVQVNNSGWIALNSTNTQLQGLANNYGGIGGGFSTLTMLVPLPSNAVQAGTNTISFQFNGTDGNSSGFRVLGLNVQLPNGTQLVSASSFTQADPSAWSAPLTDAADIAAGQTLYQTASLVVPQASGSPISIKAHCGDCHTQDGRDLKYFNYSNNSIYIRSMFHGLNSTQANQIVSYIRSLTTPAPASAAPWNPPYQPGPGLDSQPVADWAAGAGLSAVLASDSQMEQYLVPGGSTSGWAANQILNMRDLPIAMQLPDWNHWLPRIHPIDSFGSTFTSSDYAGLYPALRGQLVANSTTAYQNALGTFDNWSNAQDSLLSTFEGSVTNWDANNNRTVLYSAALWMMVKLWRSTRISASRAWPRYPSGRRQNPLELGTPPGPS